MLLTFDNTASSVEREPFEYGGTRFPQGIHLAHTQLVTDNQYGLVTLHVTPASTCTQLQIPESNQSEDNERVPKGVRCRIQIKVRNGWRER